MDNRAFEDSEKSTIVPSENGSRKRYTTESTESPDYSGSDVSIRQEKVRMKKTVGLISGTSLIVGTIIGSGIFISPKSVLDRTGSVGLSLVVWTASGFLALLGSLSYAELGTVIRKSGGEYSYIKEALGDIPAFLFAWTSVIVVRTSSMGIICLTFGEYMATFFPYCGSPIIPIKLVAALAIVSLGVINSYSTTLAGRTQVVFTFVKLIALIIIVIGGIVKLIQGNVSQFQNSFEGTTTSPSNIALAFYNALWAYDGWNNLNYVTEELKDPAKNLPRANVLGVMITTVIYLLVNISYLTAMTSLELLNSPAVAVTWGDRVLGGAAVLMPLSVLFSTFGAANGTLFGGGRVVYVAAREGHLPEMLSYVQCKYYTPFPSIIFTIVISLIMIIPGDISSLVDFFSFSAWLFYGVTVSCLIIFRFTKKDVERPIKVPIVIPILFVLIAIYLVIGPIIESPQIELLYAFLFIIGGLLFYFPFVYFKLKIKGFEWLTTSVQLLCEVVPSPYEPES
ncbi:b(0,+)-type amino acid transporter 1-like [Crassostrea angulata]|uniref:b(0,+)-type amino acid transporter 1-like n=1 Tax=Magallana angulata TaxID=2784310 RepID=UPI0022B1A3BE|nr:b(0,+)-type amino acid transporter 1-like [Crassostrea angulata]